MIVTEIFFGVKCNRCGTICSDGEFTLWSDKDSAIENVAESGWLFVGEKHYCTNCYDDEKNTPFAYFPEPLKLVQKYVEKILKGYDFTVSDTATTTKFIKLIPSKLRESEKLWIKEAAGGLFLNIEETDSYKKLSTTPFKLIVEFKNPK